ncbi:hypothetical protein JC2156_06170 [Weissella koreensis KCTC 3621]|nr:hypothetical protein JC2156_06170 [Weissella koreensis KCTC 3621]
MNSILGSIIQLTSKINGIYKYKSKDKLKNYDLPTFDIQ